MQTLSEEELNRVQVDLSHAYGLQIDRIEPIKSVFKIVCKDGEVYYFKVVRFGSEERFTELAALMRHLTEKGLHVSSPLVNRNGHYIVPLTAGCIGYLQTGLVGHHADFTRRQHRVSAVSLAAHLHDAALDFPVRHYYEVAGLTLIQKLDTKRQLWERILPEAKKRLGLFNELSQATHSGLYAWRDAVLHGVVRVSDVRFCHRDLAPHNVLFDTTIPGLIDFDLAGMDHPFVDLLQVVNHSLTLTEDETGIFDDTVTVYKQIHPLTASDERWLWTLFRFPDVLIRSVTEWAKGGFMESEQERVTAAIHKEWWRQQRLAEECPFRLYYERMG